jgi:hypothetical protein
MTFSQHIVPENTITFAVDANRKLHLLDLPHDNPLTLYTIGTYHSPARTMEDKKNQRVISFEYDIMPNPKDITDFLTYTEISMQEQVERIEDILNKNLLLMIDASADSKNGNGMLTNEHPKYTTNIFWTVV